MKVLFFGICFVAISIGSFAIAQVANTAGSIQGAPTTDSVVCNDPDKPNPYGSTARLVTDGGSKAKALLNDDGTAKTPDDGTGIH